MTPQPTSPKKPFCIKEGATKVCIWGLLALGFVIICILLPITAFKM